MLVVALASGAVQWQGGKPVAALLPTARRRCCSRDLQGQEVGVCHLANQAKHRPPLCQLCCSPP